MRVLSPLVDPTAASRRILHVDDEPDFADLTAAFLQRENDSFTVDVASNVSEGFDRLNETHYDCIVSDFDMPGQNGVEFLEAVREEYPELPFILFTGKGSEEVASGAISAGVTDYLQKEGGTDQYTVLANRISNAIDHHRSQQMVEESEQRLRDIIDSLPQILYVVDEDGRYLLANKTLASFHGTSVDEIEGSYVQDILQGPAAEQFLDDVSEVFDTGVQKQISMVQIPDAEGEVHVLEPNLVPYQLSGNGKLGVLGFAVDVTERHQRQSELKRIRERMQVALEHTESVLYEIDLETGGVNRHGAYDNFFSLPASDTPTWEDHLEKAIHPADKERFREFYQAIIDGESTGGELEYRTPPEPGDVRWIRDTVSVRSEADGGTYALGIALDITQYKERELELQKKDRQYRAVFNDPNILVGLIDIDGTVIDINQTAMDYIEESLGDIVGEPIWDAPWFNHSDALQAEVREWVERASSGEYVEFEADLVRPDGEPYTVEGVFRPVLDEDGEVVSLLISDREVTDRKETERQIRATKARYQRILEQLPGFVLIVDDAGNISYVSPAVKHVMGYDPEELIGTNAFEYVHSDDQEVAASAFAETLEHSNREVSVEYRSLRNDDTPIWIEARGGNYLDEPLIDGILVHVREITNRKEREQQLRETSSRLEALFDHSPDMIDVLDPEGILVDVNRRFCDELGYQREDFIGRPIWEFDHLVDATDVAGLLSDFQSGDRQKFEGRYERSDGSTFPVEVHLIRFDLEGEDRFLAISRDITERKTHEQEIKGLHDTAESILRADSDGEVAEIIVEATRDILSMPLNGVVYHDDSENVLRAVSWTDQGTAVLGDLPTFRPGESLAWEVFETGQTQYFDDVSEAPGRLNQDTPIRSEIIVPLGDYGVIMAGSTVESLFDEIDVSLVETLATHAVTALDRISREQALQASEARYRSLTDDVLDTSEIGTFILDSNFEVVWITEATENFFGINRDDVIGADKRQLINDHIRDIFEDSQTFVDTVLATYDDNTYVEQFECHVLAGENREERWLAHWSQPIESGTYEGGRIEHYTDITDRKRHEEQLQAQNDQLEEFASVVSHDLRNPLSVASGRLELAQEECDSEHLEAVDRAHERMTVLIDDLLSLAREGVKVKEFEPIDLADLIGGCWRNVEKNEARLRIDTDLTIEADQSRISQLIENLMRNAVEHGGESVTITIGELDDGFYVEDDGVGIPPEKRDRVFKAGFSSSDDGTGFGLSIVKQIADAHGWEVAVTEGREGGARFEITNISIAS